MDINISTPLKKIIERIPDKKRPLIIILAGVLIIFIIALPEISNGKEEKSKTDSSQNDILNNYIKDIEDKLTSIISSIDGAGEAKIMLTLDSSDENIYASDINGDKSEYVVIKKDSNEGGMLLKTIKPKIRGVAIVCEGGDNPKVKIDITNAVCTSLGITSTRVSIAKMKDRGD